MKTDTAFNRRGRGMRALLTMALVGILSAGMAAAKPVAEQIRGYWGLDGKSMLAAMKAELEEADEASRALMEAMVTEMAKSIVLEFGPDGNATMNTPEGEEKAKYKLLKVDEEAGTFELEVDPEDEEPEVIKVKIEEGKKMTMTPSDGPTMVMLKITEEEFKKRKAAKPAAPGFIPAPEEQGGGGAEEPTEPAPEGQ